MSKKSNQRKDQTSSRADLGFAGRQIIGQPAQEAWQELRADLLNNPDSLQILKKSFEASPELKENSRQDWAAKGLQPPWEGLI